MGWVGGGAGTRAAGGHFKCGEEFKKMPPGKRLRNDAEPSDPAHFSASVCVADR